MKFLATTGLGTENGAVAGHGGDGLERLLSLERVFGMGAISALGSEVAYSRIEDAFLSGT